MSIAQVGTGPLWVGTAAEWTAADYVLAQGHIGVESDTGKWKLGTDVAPWTALGYFIDAVGLQLLTAASGVGLRALLNTLAVGSLLPRTVTVTQSATPAINTDNGDLFVITGLAQDITSMSTNLTGTPAAGQKIRVSITGTATRAISWGASFEASTLALPAATNGTNRLDVDFVWNASTSKWRMADELLPIALSYLVSDTTTAVGLGSVELGHASDTTLSRSAAGRLAVEGKNAVLVDSTDTMTNKRITSRVGTVASSATPAINTDTVDQFNVTALAVAITSMSSGLTGTPTDGQMLLVRIKDNGTARAITWGASWRSAGGALPLTTVLGKTLYVEARYNAADSVWDVQRVGIEGIPLAYDRATKNTQTGTAYTLALTDASKVVEMNNAAANTLTVPPNSSVAFDTDVVVEVHQYGAGQTTIAAGAGVTIRSPGGKLKLGVQYSSATLRQRATDEWVLTGDLVS